jgi:hypothetical protein
VKPATMVLSGARFFMPGASERRQEGSQTTGQAPQVPANVLLDPLIEHVPKIPGADFLDMNSPAPLAANEERLELRVSSGGWKDLAEQ